MAVKIKYKKPPKPKPWKTNPQKAEARDQIRMLEGKGKYNVPSNICRSDGYFANSIVKQFGPIAGGGIDAIKKWINTPDDDHHAPVQLEDDHNA